MAGVALIGDLVGSRAHPSRRDVQDGLVAALRETNERVPTVQPLEPTIGDEFQAVFADVASALRATALVRLGLPEELDARFGLGVGDLTVVGESAYGLTQDGPAWWAAREAVDEISDLQRRIPGARTRLHDPGSPRQEDLVNAYLLCRDQLISDFDGRERRIASGVLDGRTLSAIADDEQISTSAVSQRYRRGVTAVVASIEQVVS